jgi:hypothetical protein
MRHAVPGFLIRFVLIFGLLIVPWSGWRNVYGDYFRGMGNVMFKQEAGKWLLYFEAHERRRGLESMDSQIVLGNRDFMDSRGDLRVDLLGIDSRSVGWIPTALTMALILATPLPWKRRGWALLWGLLLVHGYLLLVIALYIWNQSTTVELLTLPPFLKEIGDALEYTLVTQVGPGFTVPVLIWLLVAFRGENQQKSVFT